MINRKTYLAALLFSNFCLAQQSLIPNKYAEKNNNIAIEKIKKWDSTQNNSNIEQGKFHISGVHIMSDPLQAFHTLISQKYVANPDIKGKYYYVDRSSTSPTGNMKEIIKITTPDTGPNIITELKYSAEFSSTTGGLINDKVFGLGNYLPTLSERFGLPIQFADLYEIHYQVESKKIKEKSKTELAQLKAMEKLRKSKSGTIPWKINYNDNCYAIQLELEKFGGCIGDFINEFKDDFTQVIATENGSALFNRGRTKAFLWIYEGTSLYILESDRYTTRTILMYMYAPKYVNGLSSIQKEQKKRENAERRLDIKF